MRLTESETTKISILPNLIDHQEQEQEQEQGAKRSLLDEFGSFAFTQYPINISARVDRHSEPKTRRPEDPKTR